MGEGLVTEQELGRSDKGLGDPESLLFTARQVTDRDVRERRGPDRRDRVGRAALPLSGWPAGAPSVAVEAETDEVAASQRQVAIEVMLLRDITDRGVATPGGRPEHLDGAGGERAEAKDDPQERCLARAVRAEDGHERPALDGHGQVAPDHALAVRERRSSQADDGIGHGWVASRSARSRSSSCASCQSANDWYRGGIVSATPTIGMPTEAARSWIACVAGEVTWLL